MKITSKSRYAIRAIYALCVLGGEKRPVSMLKILEQEDISKKYLERIFTKLKDGNIIVGARGAGGGYMLAKAPQEITVKQIIDVMDGPLAPVDCLETRDCSKYGSCSVSRIWDGLKQSCDDYLRSVTLLDMIK